MALILTFLGKGGSGCSTVAIATAKKLALAGSRVLLVSQDSTPVLTTLLGTSVDSSPTEVTNNLQVVSLQSAQLLSQGWEDVKDLEAKYLRSPTLKNVYGQELGILPGMDGALALNSLREYDKSGKYDVIIYDGDSALNTLRMFGIPEIFSWYIRRFRQIFTESDVGKALSPFVQPITSAILNVSWSADDLADTQANDILEAGKAALGDGQRVAAYLVTTEDELAIASAKYFWGGAQQVGLTVRGVILNQGQENNPLAAEFDPLKVSNLPQRSLDNWQPLMDALPDFLGESQVPKPVTIDLAARQVKVFLPGFAKNQVKLTQYGPELTIEAGDQRRNIELPSPLAGQSVKGAKFQNHYLIVSL
ncbi:ArsA family ATPase [Crocosphaera sp. XPORK-15E]|uniref:Get3/ArsA fold putative tail anchor-mediating ATPase NosAFP n=1 Tax=Crocosphaera sp. XPORK-15E TaxID=3110247 RepID=UPI002B220F57|nr:ArsA family ATPase [Crocosphaera sp. XPORK-15E]MEA5535817.1 ArsA family ATPase [Crocosphaera sp. XPORK-15E]